MKLIIASAVFVLAPGAFAADKSPAPAKGVETGAINRAVSPCTDFYEFANGTWRASNPMPASMVRWSRRWASGELAKDQLKVILDEVSAKAAWPRGVESIMRVAPLGRMAFAVTPYLASAFAVDQVSPRMPALAAA